MRVVGEDENRRVIGRLVTPPAAPVSFPLAADGAEHFATHDVGAARLDQLVARADVRLVAGLISVPVAALPDRYEDLLQRTLPLDAAEIYELRRFQPGFADLCAELAARDVPDTVQHDDLHMANVYEHGERLLLLDWGDASIAHPFASLVVTFRFLEERNGLPRGDPWFARLRDAYLEPWGQGLVGTFELAMRVGTFAHTFAWTRQRDSLPHSARPEFDTGYSMMLRRAVAQPQELSDGT
jgi:aminoglycoside phosphotransferase (APT) family kinase protein